MGGVQLVEQAVKLHCGRHLIYIISRLAGTEKIS
jgi:hypothetical protein